MPPPLLILSTLGSLTDPSMYESLQLSTSVGLGTTWVTMWLLWGLLRHVSALKISVMIKYCSLICTNSIGKKRFALELLLFTSYDV